MTTKLTQPIKWHGGKHYLAPHIVSHFPPHLHYVEPFFGGGSVLLARDPSRDWMQRNGEKLSAHLKGCSEVVNDLNVELTNFWRVLQDASLFDEFARIVGSMPLSEIEFLEADNPIPNPRVAWSQVEAAAKFFVRNRHSRQALGKDFATLSRRRTRSRMQEMSSAWLGAVDGLPEIHERLRSVVVLCRPAVKVIAQQDGEHTLFYCDPPYLHETRSSTGEYRHEMTREQHAELLETLAGITGKFLLSGYPSKLYGDFAAQHGWARHEKEIDNKASGAKTKEKKLECLWSNF